MGTTGRVEHSIQNAYLKGGPTITSLCLTQVDGDAQLSRCPNTLFTLKISSSSRRMLNLPRQCGDIDPNSS